MDELILEKLLPEQSSCDAGGRDKSGKCKAHPGTEDICWILAQVIALVIGAIFTVFCISKIVNWSKPKQELVLQCPLPVVAQYMPSYSVNALEPDECISLGMTIGDAIGAEYNIITSTDGHTFFLDQNTENGVHLLVFSNDNGNFDYSSSKPAWIDWKDSDRASIERALSGFQTTIPESAHFVYEGNGWHRFTVNRYRDDSTLVEGTLRCRYAEDGTIRELENHLTRYTCVSNTEILPAEEAYAQLCSQETSRFIAAEEQLVVDCAFTYEQDSQGTYHPYYRFLLTSDDRQSSKEILISAIAAQSQ